MNIKTIQKIKSLSLQENYRMNLKNRLILKNANISNKIIDSKIKRREEMYNQHMQRQNRLEIARINSEVMRMKKIFKIQMKHIERDINNKYRHINQIFDIYDIKRYFIDDQIYLYKQIGNRI